MRPTDFKSRADSEWCYESKQVEYRKRKEEITKVMNNNLESWKYPCYI